LVVLFYWYKCEGPTIEQQGVKLQHETQHLRPTKSIK